MDFVFKKDNKITEKEIFEEFKNKDEEFKEKKEKSKQEDEEF